MQRARAFVFAAEEDFGIVPIEAQACGTPVIAYSRSEEHTSELQSLMRISYEVFCLKQKKIILSDATSHNTKSTPSHPTRAPAPKITLPPNCRTRQRHDKTLKKTKNP